MTRIRGTGDHEGFPYYEREGESQKSGIGVPSYRGRGDESPYYKQEGEVRNLASGDAGFSYYF